VKYLRKFRYIRCFPKEKLETILKVHCSNGVGEYIIHEFNGFCEKA
jgi:hypothetical protein